MTSALRHHLVELSASGITLKEARAWIKTNTNAPHPGIDSVRTLINEMVADGQLQTIGKNLKVYLKNDQAKAIWEQQLVDLTHSALKAADTWLNFHELRGKLAYLEGGYGGDTTLIKHALTVMLSRNALITRTVKGQSNDTVRYYRSNSATQQQLCPDLVQRGKDTALRLLGTNEQRFSTTQFKGALKLGSEECSALLDYLISEQICVPVGGTMIPIFIAAPVPLLAAAPLAPTHRPSPALRSRGRLCAPATRPVPRAPRPATARSAPRTRVVAEHAPLTLGPLTQTAQRPAAVQRGGIPPKAPRATQPAHSARHSRQRGPPVSYSKPLPRSQSPTVQTQTAVLAVIQSIPMSPTSTSAASCRLRVTQFCVDGDKPRQ